METFSALLALFKGNSPVTGEFPSQRPVTWSIDVFFDLRLNKRLSKQSWGWWFETPSCSLWRHCNVIKWSRKAVTLGAEICFLSAQNSQKATQCCHKLSVAHMRQTQLKMTSVKIAASLSRERGVDPRWAKRSLVLNGRLANHRLTSSVQEATGRWNGFKVSRTWTTYD